jgi:hypothetical protein
MPTFVCFLNWTEQGAKNAKQANKRFQASKSMARKIGRKAAQRLCDDRPLRRCSDLGDAQWRGDDKVRERHLWLGQCAHDHGSRLHAR